MRSARGIGGLPRPALNMISMLMEIVYGGAARAGAASASPSRRASRPKGRAAEARSRSRRFVIDLLLIECDDIAMSHARQDAGRSGGPAPTAIVPGAAGGIGGALCAAFREAGYRTVGVDCSPAEGVVSLDVTDTA